MTRRPRPVAGVGVVILLGVIAMFVGLLAGCTAGSAPTPEHVASAPPSSAPTVPSSSPPSAATTSRPASSSSSVARSAVTTPEGMWWGVDSTVPISDAALRNVRGWYRGARPQFWGRYVDGSYAVSRSELALARSRGVYVYLIVTDQNCSGCRGGDSCGNDRTSAQARTDATDAVADARRFGVGRGALLFKDIEEVAGCEGASAEYLRAWYRAVRGTGYRVGFYGNVHRQDFSFPRAYCAAVAADHDLRDHVVLDMNEDEPLIGAPRGSTGPGSAPRFAPKQPDCAPAGATVIWQYGESLDDDNWTDIDQARPGIAGLLAPDGTVTT